MSFIETPQEIRNSVIDRVIEHGPAILAVPAEIVLASGAAVYAGVGAVANEASRSLGAAAGARIRQERASQTVPGLLFDGAAEVIDFFKKHA